MKKKLFTFATAIALSVFTFAQANPEETEQAVQIIDILVSPTMVVDTITNLPVDNSGENLAVMCKVNDLSSIESVIILFGTAENVGDIVTINAVISENDGTYYLSIAGEMQELEENIISATIELSQQQSEAYNYIIMYVIDETELESNHLIFTK